MARKRKVPIVSQHCVEEKICVTCKEMKDATEYTYSYTSPDSLNNRCKSCAKVYYHKWVAKSDKKQLSKQRRKRYITDSETIDGRLKFLLYSATRRAKLNELDYNLTFTWLKERYAEQQGKCQLTGLPFTFEPASSITTHYSPLSPSLDRIDPHKGYTTDNVRLVCTAINLAMNEFGEAFFAQLCLAYMNNQSAPEPDLQMAC